MTDYKQIEGGTQTDKTFTRPEVSCDICGKSCPDYFVDGNTKLGGWANMCKSCHKQYGHGLGTGRGQAYQAIQ
jgi:hypothetical protein